MSYLTPAKLSRAAKLGYDRMSQMRTSRISFLQKYAGDYYGSSKLGNSSDKKATPINVLYQAISTYVANLVYNDPVADVTSETLVFRPYAEKLGLALNKIVREMSLRHTLRMTLVDALVGPGIIKTGIAHEGSMVDIDGVPYRLGSPYADRVDPDDYVLDPACRNRREADFEGHIFRVRKDALRGLLPEETINRLQPARTENLASSIGGRVNTDELYDYVELVELYLPKEGRIVTLPWGLDESASEFVTESEYNGPECGPYKVLGFTWVPNNPLPVPMAGVLSDLHEMVNRVARRVARQAAKAKKIFLYPISEEADANAMRTAGDQEFIGVESPERVVERDMGGVPDASYQFLEWAKGEFSQQAGNLDLMSGQQSEAQTATEAEMLRTSQGVRLSDMSEQLYSFTAEVMAAIAFYIHTDPLIELRLAKRVAGQEQQVVYSPEDRVGDFLDYHIKVRPYSMQRSEPRQRMMRQIDVFSRVVPAVAAATVQLAQIGVPFRADKAIMSICRDAGIELADELFPSFEDGINRAVMLSQFAPPNGNALKDQAGMPLGPPPESVRPQQPNPMAMAPQDPPDPIAQRLQEGSASAQSQMAVRDQFAGGHG